MQHSSQELEQDSSQELEQNGSLESEMDALKAQLEEQRSERGQQAVTYVIDRILGDIRTKESDIAVLMSATKGRCQKEVMQTVVKEFLRAADDVLWSPDYSLRRDSEQVIYCYTGTHWKLVNASQWKNFVRQVAQRCGVPESLCMDTSFMKKLFDAMAYSVFDYRQPVERKDEVWLNLLNSTLELKADGTVVVRGHRKEDLFFYSLPYAYDPQAQCPRWQGFLNRVLPETNARTQLGEFMGYTLMSRHHLEKMLWMFGGGQNGKSTVLNVFEAMLGKENVCSFSLDQLTNDPIVRWSFEHKLANMSRETGDRVNTSVMKRICSGEPITVEQKYVNPHETTAYGKVIMATNEFPRPENTAAFFRRILILPFTACITDEEKDVLLTPKLLTELPGILNWVLQLMPPLMRRGAFTPSESGRKALDNYMLESDNVRLFLSEMLEASEMPTHGQVIFDAYVEYCKNLHSHNLGRTKFYRHLDELTSAGVKRQNYQYFNLKLAKS